MHDTGFTQFCKTLLGRTAGGKHVQKILRRGLTETELLTCVTLHELVSPVYSLYCLVFEQTQQDVYFPPLTARSGGRGRVTI